MKELVWYLEYFIAGEMLVQASQWLQQEMHPTVIISAYREALEDLVTILKDKVGAVPCACAMTVVVLLPGKPPNLPY